MSKNRNILNVNKLQLRAVGRSKRKSKEESVPKWDAIPEYNDSPPLNKQEQEIIDSICNNNVFYSPRKRITTKFNDELQRWQALGFQSEDEHIAWKRLNNRDDTSSTYTDLADTILKITQGQKID
ncbi:hypothetical protein HCH46_01225 [Klebsiella michiganensis]|uniref:hypothetical protein n=1 Tax=Klebsiella michiganensis TaxID=1134687 RepID=UPI001C8B0C57|nr:hypothetical protein [Klebsiella michiganensis]MBX8828733.1 hypothetical protein [Klebsiella michiganensis]MBX8847351.1 hypothetical protein [Klebsiella michiganensis]MBX8867262.1 hypothetical protein [Klebsiella michiganensis]